MAHIDYDAVTSLDALIDVSDAGARASMLALRDQLGRLGLEERVVMDGQHRKPVIGFYRGDSSVLHVYPEPGVGTGLHVTIPLRTEERRLMKLSGLSPWLREAIERARPRHNVVWVEALCHSPGRVDELMNLVLRKIEMMPTVH